MALLAISLGGLGIAGGVIYLAEKLINLAKGVGFMLAELIVEKFKKHEREVGMRIGLEKGQEVGRQVGRQEGLQEGLQVGRREGEQVGQQVGREEVQQQWQDWYERQQAALRSGQPFTEPPPGHSANGSSDK